jgi:hypothetical protein
MSNHRHVVPFVDKIPEDISKACSRCPLIQRDVGLIAASAEETNVSVAKMYSVFMGDLKIQGILGRMKSLEEKFEILLRRKR